MTAISEALTLFIEARKREALHADLLDRWDWGMETQLTVHQADGEVHADHPSVFSNGITDWWPIRIPKNAGGEPHFKDYELTWPIRDYWDSLGITGWNWLEKKSLCMGADFDTITGHALGVGITDGTLAEVKDRASQIPFVEVRHSTRGKGIHLWVDFEREDIIIENHHDHAAVCRAVLGEMSRLAEFDFQASVDVCGGNMWIDHRKQHANQFALIEPATEKFKISSVDWESHRDVIKGTRTTVRIAKIDDEEQDELDLLTHSRHKTQPDATHLRVQQTLIDNGVVCVYVPDHNLFQLHTHGLKQIASDFRGAFDTVSEGTNLQQPNAFAFPEPDRVLKVIRFGKQVNETACFEETDNGWMAARFNAPLSYEQAMEWSGGVLCENGESYGFDKVTNARDAIMLTECFAEPHVPDELGYRKCVVFINKHGHAVIKLDREKGETRPKCFAESGRNSWSQTCKLRGSQPVRATSELDDCFRYTVSLGNSDELFFVKNRDHGWIDTKRTAPFLSAKGVGDTSVYIGNLQENHTYQRVGVHHGGIHPTPTTWNLYGKQKPKMKEGEFPTWQRMFDHLGQALDSGFRRSMWCDRNEVDGATWLFYWFTLIHQDPYQLLPAVYLYSWDTGRGKSTMCRAAEVAYPDHHCDFYRPLMKGTQFNGEFYNQIIGIAEEKDLQKVDNEEVLNLITRRTLPIRKMQTDTFMSRNSMHLLSTNNDPKEFAIRRVDRRIVLSDDLPMFTGKEIEESEMVRQLAEELPAISHAWEHTKVPELNTQLRLPVLVTDAKQELIETGKILRDDAKLERERFDKKINEFITSCSFVTAKPTDLLRRFNGHDGEVTSKAFGESMTRLDFHKNGYGEYVLAT